MFVRAEKGVFQNYFPFRSVKGAANEAFNAGSKAAEQIVDEKLKEAESVSILHFSQYLRLQIIDIERLKFNRHLIMA